MSPPKNSFDTVDSQSVLRNIQLRPDQQDLNHTESMAELNEQMDLGHEQSFFDLDPELYYGAHNNSCGFFPGVAPLISDIDQASIDELMFGDEYAPRTSDKPESV